MLNNIKERLESGELSFCQAFAEAKELIKSLESFVSDIEKDAKSEAEQFNKDEPYFGYVWSIRKGYPIFDFDADSEYSSFKNQLKDREKLLKEASLAAMDNKVFFNADSGEELPKVPVKSYTKDSLIFTKPKTK